MYNYKKTILPDDSTISEDSYVKVTFSGNIISIKYSEHHSNSCNIKRISKNYYCDKKGEVFEYSHSGSRTSHIYNFYNSLTKCRNKINCNFNANQTLFLTLTYSKDKVKYQPFPMNNHDYITRDMNLFVKKLKYRFDINKYLYTIEPQLNGSWHSHLLLTMSNDKENPFIDNHDIERMWQYGFTYPVGVHKVHNLGLYLTCFQTDIDVDEIPSNYDTSKYEKEERKIILPSGEEVTKAFFKGARIPMYLPNKKIYVPSHGLNNPETKVMRYGSIKEIINQHKAYSQGIKIELKDFENIIIYEEYDLSKKISPCKEQ